MEALSEHPIARAIAGFAREQGVLAEGASAPSVSGFEGVPGGVRGVLSGAGEGAAENGAPSWLWWVPRVPAGGGCAAE